MTRFVSDLRDTIYGDALEQGRRAWWYGGAKSLDEFEFENEAVRENFTIGWTLAQEAQVRGMASPFITESGLARTTPGRFVPGSDGRPDLNTIVRIPTIEDCVWGWNGLTFQKELEDEALGYCLVLLENKSSICIGRWRDIADEDGWTMMSYFVLPGVDKEGNLLLDGHEFDREERAALAQALINRLLHDPKLPGTYVHPVIEDRQELSASIR